MDINIVEIPPDELVEGNQYFFLWNPPLDNVQMNLRSGTFTGYIIDPFEGFSFENIRIMNANYPDVLIPNENYSANIGPRTLHFYRYVIDVQLDEINSSSPAAAAAAGVKKRKSRSLKRKKSRRNMRLKHRKSRRK
jgi:hypothetical protein